MPLSKVDKSKQCYLHPNTYTDNMHICFSDSFSILGLWVLGLAVSHINESNCKLMSPDDKSAILLHPGIAEIKTLHP